MVNALKRKLNEPTDILPLVSFRILFGVLTAFGLIWSILKGDLQNRYWSPDFFFDYYGLEWLPYVGDQGILCIYIAGIIAALGIAFGFLFRFNALLFLFSFSYLHSIDASNFINHYYLIWVFGLYLLLSPAHRCFSLDVYLNLVKPRQKISRFYVLSFQIQLGIVYTFAGLAKLNADWLLGAMPMKIWLLQLQDFPILGHLFKLNWVHYGMSWLGAFYDLIIVWALIWGKSRRIAFLVLLIFHGMTGLLFDIGLFPPLMIISAFWFFPARWHRSWYSRLRLPSAQQLSNGSRVPKRSGFTLLFLSCFLLIQLLLPIRHLFFTSSDIKWTQCYYRYGWRVMLVEHEGLARFRVVETNGDRIWEPSSKDFLTGYQEKRMAVQPEQIRQFAHFLADHYQTTYQLMDRPKVYAEVFVSLNGRLSRRLIDPKVDLASKTASWRMPDWVYP